MGDESRSRSYPCPTPKISQRHIHAGVFFAVVVYAQSHQARPREFVVGHRDPDL